MEASLLNFRCSSDIFKFSHCEFSHYAHHPSANWLIITSAHHFLLFNNKYFDASYIASVNNLSSLVAFV